MGRRFDAYRLRPQAREDLAGIWDYTATAWSPERADAYIRLIVSALEAAVAGRKELRLLEETGAGYRKVIAGSHFAVLREDAGTLIVVRVLHQRMDPSRHL